MTFDIRHQCRICLALQRPRTGETPKPSKWDGILICAEHEARRDARVVPGIQ